MLLFSKCSKITQYLQFRHLNLFLFLVGYSILGGWLFSFLEYEAHGKKIAGREAIHEQIRERFVQRMSELFQDIRAKNSSSWNEVVGIARSKTLKGIKWYESQIGIMADLEKRRWTLMDGIFYAGTLITTIGYGNLVPGTNLGRLATVIYSIFGIPLLVSVLNDWGNMLFTMMDFLWRKLSSYCHQLKQALKRNRSIISSFEKGAKSSSTVEKGRENLKNSNFKVPGEELPIFMVVLILFSWILICSSIFYIWEVWSYFECFYFFFISLTTIGLGDYVPENQKFTVLNLLLVLIGLSVVSSSINVVQAKLESMFNKKVGKIDREFKENLAKGQTAEGIGVATTEETPKVQKRATLGGLSIFKRPKQGENWKDKMLSQFMSNHAKRLLEDHLEKRLKLKNQATQTGTLMKSVTVQASEDDVKNKEGGELVDTDERLSKPGVFTARKYIYNCDD